MKKKLTIPEPCHEDWNKMSPTQKGKFCKSCAKDVVDFTKNSKEEIIDYLSDATGKTCGRFKTSQIDESSITRKFSSPLIPYAKVVAASTVTLLGMTLQEVKAQGQVKYQYPVMGKIKVMPIEETATNTEVLELKGKVTFALQGEIGVGGVNVFVKSGEESVAKTKTDENGNYSLELDKGKILNNKISIIAADEYGDFIPKTVKDLSIKDKVTTLNIALEADIMIMGDIAYHEEPVAEVIEEDTTIVEQDTSQLNLNEDETPINEKVNFGDEPIVNIIVGVGTTVKAIEEEPVEEIEELEVPLPDEPIDVNPEDNARLLEPLSHELEIKVSPNLSADLMNVNFNRVGEFSYKVYDLNSRFIAEGKVSANEFLLDMSSKAPGTYIINFFENNEAIASKKIVVSR